LQKYYAAAELKTQEARSHFSGGRSLLFAMLCLDATTTRRTAYAPALTALPAGQQDS
jgi:hypothetical protein